MERYKKKEEKEKKVSGLSVFAISFGLDGDGLFRLIDLGLMEMGSF